MGDGRGGRRRQRGCPRGCTAGWRLQQLCRPVCGGGVLLEPRLAATFASQTLGSCQMHSCAHCKCLLDVSPIPTLIYPRSFRVTSAALLLTSLPVHTSSCCNHQRASACALQVVVNHLMRASVESMRLGDDVIAHPVLVPDSSADSSGVSSDEDSSPDDNTPVKAADAEVKNTLELV